VSPSPYISVRGYERLQQEVKALWRRRQGVVAALSAAAAEGDRSENAEYIYRKRELREIDRRIGYLQRRLPRLKVVTRPPEHWGQVFFGAWVTLEDETGTTQRYRILGADEFDDHPQGISIDSPLARALIGKTMSEICMILHHSPQAVTNYLSTFVRCVQLAQQGMQVGQIAFVVRRGPRLVERYLDLRSQCESDRNMAYHLEELNRIGCVGGKKKQRGGAIHG